MDDPRRNYAAVSLKGACIDADWRIFFYPSTYPLALEYCANCPVIDDCRALCAHFDTEYLTDGVWAGTTPEQRKSQRQNRRYQEWLAEQSEPLSLAYRNSLR